MRSTITRIALPLVAATSFVLVGCQALDPLPQAASAPQPQRSGLLTLNQNEPLPLLDGRMELLIEQCYWTDEVSMFAEQNLQGITEQQRQAMMRKPQAHFLVVEFKLTNLTQSPLRVSETPLLFKLESPNGAIYGNEVLPGDMTQEFIAHQAADVNPGMWKTGRSVFDVPKDEHIMNVYILGARQGYHYFSETLIAKWILEPHDEEID